MKGAVAKLLREPLVHFLLIGAAFFAVYRIRGDATSEAGGRIVIGAGQVERMALTFSRVYMRPPTAEELQGLIEKEIREEVYSREAMAMGLDRNDEIIRRRLQQKMEFLSEDVGAQQQPTDAQLHEHLDRNPERYRTDAKLGFRQAYVGGERQGEDAQREARRLLERLRAAGPAADIRNLGDRIGLPQDYSASAAADVSKDFGSAFTEALLKLPVGSWEGPVASGYGLHLVLVRERTPGVTLPLAQARTEVERDWQAERREELNRRLYERLRAKYAITVELPASAMPNPK